MADMVILSDYPDIGDRKRNLSDNHGGYFWHLLYSNKAPTWDLKVEYLYDSFQDMLNGNNRWRSIEARHKPKVVMALGKATLRNFNIEGSIHEVRGSVVKVERRTRNMFVIPTYHPRDLKDPVRMFGDEPVSKGYVCAGDILRATQVYHNGWEIPEERFNIDPTVEEVEAFVEEAIDKQYLLGTDLEGTGLNLETTEIVVAGFAWSESDAIVVPFRKEGGAFYYSATDWIRVKQALQRLFIEGRFMYQNGVGYDIPLLRQRGWTVPLEQFEVDTMVLHHTLSPELPHKIGFINSQFGKQPFWKNVMKDFWGLKIYTADQNEMKLYNARDCVALHQIHNGMNSYLDRMIKLDPDVYGGLPKIFEDAMELSRAVMITAEQGILLHNPNLTKWRKFIDSEIKGIDAKIADLVSLPPSFNLGSSDDVRFWLYGEMPRKLEKFNDRDLERYDHDTFSFQFACPYCGRKRSKGFQPDLEQVPETLSVDCPKCNIKVVMRRTDKAPNKGKGKSKDTDTYRKLNTLRELKTLEPLFKLRGYIPLTSKKSDNSAINKGALTRYIIFLDKRLDYLENDMKRKLPQHNEEEKKLKHTKSVLIVLQNYNKIKKLQESFYTFKTRQDGKVYPHLLVTGTSTGRFSCKDPNAQQFPGTFLDDDDNKIIAVRDCFKADAGCELMSVDFKNLEVVIGAYFMQDRALIDIVEAGVNFHDFNTKVFFGIEKDHPKWKSYRRVAKIIVFAKIMYGGSDGGIYAQVMTEQPNCGLTLKGFKQAIANYMGVHPDYIKWCEEVQELARTKRISINAYGRVRTLLGRKDAVSRQALNSPIQGSAADAVREDYVMLNKAFLEGGHKARIILQVHDEFIFHYPIEEREIVANLAKEIMGRKREINGREFTIGLDAEVGTYWGSLNGLDLDTMEVSDGSKH